MSAVRHDWTIAQIRALYDLPLMQLLDRAREVHRAHHAADEVQLCTLLSIKTGGCPENCSYCSQSAHYDTGLQREPMVSVEQVLDAAQRAKESGASRFCMGAAWREVKNGPQFDGVLDMVRGVKALGLEACCTLGMLSAEQAGRLKEAGLDAYNHNIDTSAAHYRSIVSTRTQADRFQTLSNVRAAGITVCSGGIIGMGESVDDRCAMLMQLANLSPQPESVPINTLARIPGTPLADLPPIDSLELVRTIACARLVMPLSRVRLSAGRKELARDSQLLCLMAGANSIFYGDRLLTTGNPDVESDLAFMRECGLRPASAAE